MGAVVSWVLPLVLAALGNALDAWAQNATHVGGWVATVAAVWLALRLHPNGVNGPPKEKRAALTVVRDEPAAPEPQGMSEEEIRRIHDMP